MFRELHKRKAQSSIEYMATLIILMLALLLFGKYIYRAFAGNWRGTGATFGMGMQYEPGNTIMCRYDTYAGTGVWYNLFCFEENCDCHTVSATDSTCRDCILACEIPECQPT